MPVSNNPVNGTRAQQVSYYAGLLNQEPGTYQGNDTAYRGMSWGSLYEQLASKYPQYSAQQLAQTVLGAYAAQSVGQGAAAAGNIDAQVIAEAPKAAAGTAAQIGKTPVLGAVANGASGIFSGITDTLSLGKDIYGTLTSSNLWIRIAKVIIGGVVMVIGLAHISGASNAVAQAARKVPLPV